MAEDKKSKVIVLEQKPEIGQIPLTHIQSVVKLYDEDPPCNTEIVRQSLKAFGECSQLYKNALKLRLCDDITWPGVVKHSIELALKFKIHQLKQLEQTGSSKK
jgi:hypothetical protein